MPILSGSKVIFQGGGYMSSCPKRIEVDDNDGEILGVFKTCAP
jgi:hypothetical protein